MRYEKKKARACMDDKEAQSQIGRRANRAYTPRQRRTLTMDEKVKEVLRKRDVRRPYRIAQGEMLHCQFSADEENTENMLETKRGDWCKKTTSLHWKWHREIRRF